MTLYAPDITCDHCIATIERAVSGQAGAKFLAGDVESRSFAIEVVEGRVVDAVARALAEEGYPLGPAYQAGAGEGGPAVAEGPPTYRVTPTDAGAEINYDCPCGCVAGFAFDRAIANADPESCCCGRTMLVGGGAEERLRSGLGEQDSYRFDLQTVTMPWGQPMEVALAIPRPASEGAD